MCVAIETRTMERNEIKRKQEKSFSFFSNCQALTCVSIKMSLEIYKLKWMWILITILFLSFYNFLCYFLSLPLLSFHLWYRAYRGFSECAFASLEVKCHKELMHTYFSAPAIYNSTIGFNCTNWFQFFVALLSPVAFSLMERLFFRAIKYISTL